jgi:hypothetical protein
MWECDASFVVFAKQHDLSRKMQNRCATLHTTIIYEDGTCQAEMIGAKRTQARFEANGDELWL